MNKAKKNKLGELSSNYEKILKYGIREYSWVDVVKSEGGNKYIFKPEVFVSNPTVIMEFADEDINKVIKDEDANFIYCNVDCCLREMYDFNGIDSTINILGLLLKEDFVFIYRLFEIGVYTNNTVMKMYESDDASLEFYIQVPTGYEADSQDYLKVTITSPNIKTNMEIYKTLFDNRSGFYHSEYKLMDAYRLNCEWANKQ